MELNNSDIITVDHDDQSDVIREFVEDHMVHELTELIQTRFTSALNTSSTRETISNCIQTFIDDHSHQSEEGDLTIENLNECSHVRVADNDGGTITYHLNDQQNSNLNSPVPSLEEYYYGIQYFANNGRQSFGHPCCEIPLNADAIEDFQVPEGMIEHSTNDQVNIVGCLEDEWTYYDRPILGVMGHVESNDEKRVTSNCVASDLIEEYEIRKRMKDKI